jgi:menaquinone-dependent protoporphyrinogen oxidase
MRILVTAASKHGATSELAAWMGEALQAAGIEAVVMPPEKVADVDGIDAVIIGSGVYAGHWLEAAKTFVDARSAELRARPVWLFSSGPVGEPLKPEEVPVDVKAIEEATGAREHQIFPGRIDRSLLSLGEKALCTALRVPEGDWRSRPDVERWVREIAASLVTPAGAA